MAKFEVEGVFKLTDNGSKATLDGIKRSIEGIGEAAKNVSVEEVAPGIGELKTRVDALAASENKLAAASNQAAAATGKLATETRLASQAAATTSQGFVGIAQKVLGLGSAVAVIATLRNAVSALANATEQTRADFDGLSNEVGQVFTPAAERASLAAAALAGGVRAAAEPTSLWSRAIDAVSESLKRQYPLVTLMVGSVEKLGEAERARADKIAEFWARGESQANAYEQRVSSINETVRELGITLDVDVNNAVDAHEQKIRLLTQAYDQRQISEEVWLRSTDALRAKISDLRGETEASTIAIGDYATAAGGATEALRALSDDGMGALGESTPELIETLRDLIDVLREVEIAGASASRAVSSVGGGSAQTGRVTSSNYRSLAARTSNPISRGFGGTTRSSRFAPGQSTLI